MTEKKEEYVVTPEEAQEVLKAAERQRVEACDEEIGQVLRKHGCEMAAVPTFTADGRVTAVVRLRVKQR